MQLKHFSSLLATLSLAAADLMVTAPAAGAAASIAGGSLAVSFGAGPNTNIPPSAITKIDVTLLAGGVNVGTDTIACADSGAVAYAGTYNLPVVLSKIPAGAPANAFYLQITSTTSSGTLINYSSRFTLSGGTGTWTNAAAQSALSSITSPAQVPAAQLPAGAAAGAAATSSGAAAGAGPGNSNWGDPHPTGTWPAYSLQGASIVKMAPMQGRPGPSITQTNTAPQFPTSSWSVFQTFYPIPIQVHTNTPSPTMSAISRENTASPAAAPSDDMAKFLARWKD